ncbi:hypothetical protein [Catelliglobosispora koreensis]|uniref:hypothetical protein n=1 Tax=Catelliglobosispora koreensis TaxID=129052 RepID=UPI0003635388|nr:hypothetical protein [Catelliglobosispora koreensis]
MRRLLWSAGAIFPILFALVGNLATNSVKIPPSWAPWVWLGTIALGLFLATQAYRHAAGATVEASEGKVEVELRPVQGESRVLGTTLDTSQQHRRRLYQTLWVMGALMVLLALTCWIPGPGAADKGFFDAAEKGPSLYESYPWPVGLGLTIIFLPCAITALVLVRSSRRTLEFTGEAVTFTKGRRTPMIVPWSEITNIEVRSYWGSGKWLIAFPRAGSLLLTTEPTMSAFRPNKKAIWICNLGEAGFPRHAVEAAIQQWRP